MNPSLAATEPIQIYEDIHSHLEKTDEYIPEDQKQKFELRVATKLNDLVGELIRESAVFIPAERKKEFELRLIWALADCIEELLNDALSRSDGSSKQIKEIWLGLRMKAEVTARRLELQSPNSVESYRANLWWMGERGVEEDLDLVRKAKKNPPYAMNDIRHLISDTEEMIAERIEDPDYVVRKGEETYQKYKSLWDKIYSGKFIAIHKGDVIAESEDESELVGEIIRLQKERKKPFRAYIVEIGADVSTIRKPEHPFRADAGGGEGGADERPSGAAVQRIGWSTFRQQLPELLEQFAGRWVAYHGRARVAMSYSNPEIYDQLVRQNYPLNEVVVCCVEPLGPHVDLRRLHGRRVR